jgi:hypothetical protein
VTLKPLLQNIRNSGFSSFNTSSREHYVNSNTLLPSFTGFPRVLFPENNSIRGISSFFKGI